MAKTYQLKSPITVSGNVIDQVEIREPVFAELLEHGIPDDSATPIEKLAAFSKYMALCTGLSDDVIQQIKVSDALAIVKIVAGFFGDSD